MTAISKVPTPRNVGDVCRFLRMTNQMPKFSPNLAEETKALREVLVKGNEWIWTEPQESAFERIKTMLAKAPILAQTVLSVDASSFGLGAVLQPAGVLKPVPYTSRSMTPTE